MKKSNLKPKERRNLVQPATRRFGEGKGMWASSHWTMVMDKKLSCPLHRNSAQRIFFLWLISFWLLWINGRLPTHEYVLCLVSWITLNLLLQIEISAANLVSTYKYDLDPSLGIELIQFCEFANFFEKEKPVEISQEHFFYKLIFDKRMNDTFANVETALRMYLVLMVSNCSGERSFNKLKLVKNRLRSTWVRNALMTWQ